MITSAKNYTKKKTDRQNPSTNGESKAIQTKSHTEAYTNTLTKRGKELIDRCKNKSSFATQNSLFSMSFDTGKKEHDT